jgi:hypothetical protein
MGFCCPPQSPTLREMAGESKVILLGAVCQAREDGRGGGTTEFHVEHVFKSDPVLGGQKVVHLPILIEPDDGPRQFLLFADVARDKLDVFAGLPATPALVDHFRRVLALDGRDPAGVLRYYFDHLQDADETVALDAHREFLRADDGDIIRGAKAFSPRKLRGWLADPKASPQRLHLYGLLLGHCGDARDAALLGRLARKLTTDEPSSAADGVLTGYTLVDPRGGWALVRQLLGDESRHFAVRYMAFRTARYLHKARPDHIPAKDIIEAMALLLDQKDIADLTIDEFRCRHCWETADHVLALYGRPGYGQPFMRRSILRYALQCPGPKAAAFVAGLRQKDPRVVADVEELLRLEGEGTSEGKPAAKGVQ